MPWFIWLFIFGFLLTFWLVYRVSVKKPVSPLSSITGHRSHAYTTAAAGGAVTAAALYASQSDWSDDEDNFYHHSNWLEPDDPFYTEYESGIALFNETYGSGSMGVNPATGLPMMDNSVDVHGNPFGTDMNEVDSTIDDRSLSNNLMDVNPATGLPMMDDVIDVHGNPFGSDLMKLTQQSMITALVTTSWTVMTLWIATAALMMVWTHLIVLTVTLE